MVQHVEEHDAIQRSIDERPRARGIDLVIVPFSFEDVAGVDIRQEQLGEARTRPQLDDLAARIRFQGNFDFRVPIPVQRPQRRVLRPAALMTVESLECFLLN
jgi:hypothetical protein